MFQSFKDFNGQIFNGLGGGFSCRCSVDDVNACVMFFKGGKEVLSYKGQEANDVLDFVLSEYYKDEKSTIEGCFNMWLFEHFLSCNGNFARDTSLGQTEDEKYVILLRELKSLKTNINNLWRSVRHIEKCLEEKEL